MTIIQCPVCGQELKADEKQWYCAENHRFDIARQGYVNLLLANQKKSATPGDDRTMLEARCRFLSTAHYQPVAKTMVQIINDYCQPLSQIIDVGCGEGYYLHFLQQHLSTTHVEYYGTDISREALRLAARQHKDIHWLVAAAKKLPFLDHRADLVLNIFAPADWNEIRRVLRKQGFVLLAVAGENHLLGLRELLYDEVRPHQPSRFLDRISHDFELIASKSCQFELQLDDNDSIRSLLQMTPYYWQSSLQRRQSIENLQSLNTPVNVQFYLFQA